MTRGERGAKARRGWVNALLATAVAVPAVFVAPTAPAMAATTTVLDVRVSSSTSDAEESATGSISTGSSDLEMTLETTTQTVGIRFENLTIPQGAVISNAWVQFAADETNSEATDLTIQGEAVDDASAFVKSSLNITSRPLTSASVTWSPPPWLTRNEAGPDQTTPDLTPVIQEVLNRQGWSSGNSLALIISGTGKRVADSYDGAPAAAPLLHVEYAVSVSVQAIDPWATEGAAPTDEGMLRFTRTGPTSQNLTVTYTVGGDATPDVDYTALPGTVIIPVGAQWADVVVSPIDDSSVEGTETVDVTVIDTADYFAGLAASAGITILDDETPIVSVTTTDGSATEGASPPDPAEFTVTRSGPVTGDLTVSYAVGGDATPGADYVTLSGTVTIPDGQTSATVPVSTLDDPEDEFDETVTLTVVDGTGYAAGPPISASVTIIDDDQPDEIRFAAFGDFGFDDAGEAAVAAQVDSLGVDFIVTTGDNRYIDDIDLAVGKYYADYIGDYQGAFGPGSPVNRFFPSLGNHEYSELGGLPVYLDYFTLPGAGILTSGTSGNERYYDFIQGPVHFFVINSNSSEPDGRTSTSIQAQWLQTQLAASSSAWKVVAMHHPPFSSSGGTVDMRWPYKEWGADVLLAGHVHSYEKNIVDGFPYFIVGTGGGKGTMLVTACTTSMLLEFHDVNAGVTDQHTLGAASCSVVGSPPVAADDTASTDEDVAVTIDVAANDSDVDGNLDVTTVNTTCVGCTAPTNGSLTNNGDGTFTYTPDPDVNGSDSFTYEICDSLGACDTALVSLTINPINDPPVANDDSATTDEDTAVTIDVGANDTDADGNLDPTTTNTVCVGCSVPANGALVNNGDGTFGYTPDPDFNGSNSFTYEICDTLGACDTALVSLTINPINDPPVANDDTASTDEDVSVTVDLLVNDTDSEGVPLSVTNLIQPADGSVVDNGDGTVTYTPDPDFNGSDSFTYTANDGVADSNVATVSITVDPINDLPVANDDSAVTSQDTAVIIDVVGNDTDVDGNLDPTTTNTICAGCSVPVNGSLVNNVDGTFTYTPNTGFNGTDSFTYEICDTLGACDTAATDITVSADQVIFVSSSSSGTAGGVSFKDEDVLVFDPDTGSWSMYLDGSDVGLGAGGQEIDAFHLLADGSMLLSLGSDGTIPDVGAVDDHDIVRFVPTSTGDVTAGSFELYFNGEDFELAARGEDIDAISFDPAGRLVVSTRSSYSVAGFSGKDEDLIVFDSGSWNLYLDGAALALTASSEDVNGTWIDANGDVYLTVKGAFDVGSLTGDGADILACLPGSTGPITACTFAMFWDGSDAANGFGGEVLNAFFVSGSGIPTNDPPVAGDDTAAPDEDTAVSVDVLVNDIDSEGDPLSVTNLAQPANGSVVVNGDQTVTYTPDPDYNGTDSFTYTANDGFSDSNVATVSITINAVNDPPVAGDDSVVTSQDTAVTIDVTANDTDVDGDVLGVTNLSDPAGGSLTNNGDGTVTYTPDPGFNGSDSFTYTANDGVADSNVATVSVTVTVPNDPPVANDDTATTDEDTAVTVDVAANDTDVDGNLDPTTANTTCAGCADPANGSLTNNGDGTFGYTPDADFNGTDSFTYEICDSLGACDTAVVSLTINPINDPPVTADDTASTDEDVAVTIDVAANDSDVDGNLDVTTVNTICAGCADPANGSLTNNVDGTFTYTPNTGFNGTDSFTYEICDTLGACDTALVAVTVTGGVVYYMSFDLNTTVPGIGYEARDEDILSYDTATGFWSVYFDASDVGITSSDLDAFHIRDDGSVLISFSSTLTIPGLTGGPTGESVEENDVVLFIPTSTGDDTAGSFSFYFDGSDVGLDTTSEDITGLHEFADGSLGISTSGSPTVPGLTGVKDEDVIRFTGTFGSDITGTWSMYFDGSDVGFTTSGDDLDAISFVDDIDLLFSTKSPYVAAGGAGEDEDISRFTGTFGDPTSGSAVLELDISSLGIDPALDLDGLAVR